MTTTTSELLSKAQAARAALRASSATSLRRPRTGPSTPWPTPWRVKPRSSWRPTPRNMAAGKESGLSSALLARLELTPSKLAAMADGARSIAALSDPVGEIIDERTLPNGIELARRRVPLGVIGTIFEARPEVPVDFSSLCLKSGNAVVMRGGKEAVNTNRALGELVRSALDRSGVTPGAVQMVHSTDQGHRGRDGEAERIHRSAHPSRRLWPDPLRGPGGHHARHHRGHRRLPHLRGRQRGPGHGPGDRLQRQGPGAGGVQRPGHAAGPRGLGATTASRKWLPAWAPLGWSSGATPGPSACWARAPGPR